MLNELNTASWLQPHLESVLRNDRAVAVLSSWRKQLPALSGRMKNFENWLLVELAHDVRDGARVVLTNGFFAEGTDALAPKRVKARDVRGLRGAASKATYLSADLSVRPKSGGYLIAEIKTGMAKVELLDDLKRVRFYKQAGIATQAEVGWVVMLATDSTARRAGQEAFEKIRRELNGKPDVLMKVTEITDWLLACTILPTPPNKALHPSAPSAFERRG